ILRNGIFEFHLAARDHVGEQCAGERFRYRPNLEHRVAVESNTGKSRNACSLNSRRFPLLQDRDDNPHGAFGRDSFLHDRPQCGVGNELLRKREPRNNNKQEEKKFFHRAYLIPNPAPLWLFREPPAPLWWYTEHIPP